MGYMSSKLKRAICLLDTLPFTYFHIFIIFLYLGFSRIYAGTKFGSSERERWQKDKYVWET